MATLVLHRTMETPTLQQKTGQVEPVVHSIYETRTGTWQYIVADPGKRVAVIVDSVLDYNKDTGVITTQSADRLLALTEENGYTITHILETHVHADHPTASRYLQNVLAQRSPHRRPLVCIGKRVRDVQNILGGIYQIPAEHMKDSFDDTFEDNEELRIGDVEGHIIHLPGHTPDHIGYVIGTNVLTGDSLFNPDVGSARCDFPGGDAPALFESVQKLLALPAHYRLYTGHDYPPESRKLECDQGPKPVPFTTVEKQRAENKHLKRGTEKADFVEWRATRDSTLAEPKLMLVSMHINLRGGRVPVKAVDGPRIDEESLPEHLVRI